jgi:FkbM family methyltransferase
VARFLAHRPYFYGRDRLTAAILRLAQRLGPPVTVEIDGFSLQLDLNDGLSRTLWLTRALPQSGYALKAICEPGDVVIDVGANLGYMALIAAREVGFSGRVIAIEPCRRSFALLSANAARNFPGRIVAVCAACDETDGIATVFVSDESEEYSSLHPGAIPGKSHREIVQSRSLRSLTSELEVSADVVKVDVEGAEWRVLKGLLDGGGGPRGLVIEVYAANARQFGYAPSEMCRWLSDKGYQVAVASDTDRYEYSDALVDGPELHDVIATR